MSKLLQTTVFAALSAGLLLAGALQVQAKGRLRVALVGDPQVDSEKELSYARRSIYRELRERKDLDLVIVLGDLVNEKTELIAPSEASLDSLPCPWARVNGNHDGPDPVKDTAITAGGIRFILMDDVRRVRKRGYEGGFNETQKRWLDSLVRATPEKMPLVLCAHIPFTEIRGRDSLLNILAGREKVLLACAHLHQIYRSIPWRGLEELNAGATCGSWWRGVKDERGIPSALMNCGAPRGYFIADFQPGSGKWYRLSYKAVDRTDEASAWLEGNRLIINVFGGSPEGDVTVKAGGRTYKARHSYEYAPECIGVINWTRSHTREYRKEHKEEFIPMRRMSSPHIWSVEGFEGRTGDEVRVIYTDRAMKSDSRTSILDKPELQQ